MRQTLARLISYLECTWDFRQFSHVGDKASECKLGFFQHADVAGDLTDLKSASGGMLWFGDHAFVPISWACKKQTAVSHSTEAKVISLDTGLRTEALLALTLLDIVIDALDVPASRAGTPRVNSNPKHHQTVQEMH